MTVRTGRVISDITISVDGYSAGLNQTEERPFGDDGGDGTGAGPHAWMFDTPDENRAEIDPLTGFRPWRYLLETWRELDVPEGWSAEIDEGRIVLVPPPSRPHHSIVAGVKRRLYPGLPEELGSYQTLGVHIAPLDKLYAPDLVIMPSDAVDAVDAVDPDSNDPVDAAEALLIVEITSKGNARDDRTKKYRACARPLVPLHLLIDRFGTRGPVVTLFTEPNEDGTYKHSEQVPFGKPIALPEPFRTTLETAAFPV